MASQRNAFNVNQLQRIGTSMALEQSVDANNNLTEMNLVNDATGVSQLNLHNDMSQVTLTNANPDQTSSQVIIDADDSALLPQRAGVINRNLNN